MTDAKRMSIERPIPIRKQVYEYLRTQILEHSLKPSERLVEAQIAKDLGISRTPIREALHLLEKDGFVESIPRVGYKVMSLDWDDLEEIIEIRKVNEILACRWAVEKIDEKDLAALEENLVFSQSALDAGSPAKFLECDEQFHEILVSSAGSKHLLELCQQLRRLMIRYRSQSMHTIEAGAATFGLASIKAAFEGHIRIVGCLKSRDAAGVESAMVQHLEQAKKDIQSYV